MDVNFEVVVASSKHRSRFVERGAGGPFAEVKKMDGGGTNMNTRFKVGVGPTSKAGQKRAGDG